MFANIWICGHAENVPMHSSTFWLFGKSDMFWKPNISLFQGFPDYYLLNIYLFHTFPDYFAGFRVPKPFASVSQLPAALRLPQKKHAPRKNKLTIKLFGGFVWRVMVSCKCRCSRACREPIGSLYK
jgi:hypothetical protein